MNIEDLQEVLGDQYEPLKSYVDDLVGQRDAARNESINKRKALQAKVQELESAQATLLERLGIESTEELDDLPDVKGQADAVRQHEAKIARLQRELQERQQQVEDLSGRYRQSTLDARLSKALATHEFIDADLVAEYIKHRVEWEGDEAVFRTEDGQVLPVEEGAGYLAQTKPHLVKASGAGGSGHVRTGKGQANNPWLRETRNLTEQARILRENPQLAEQLRAAAGAT